MQGIAKGKSRARRVRAAVVLGSSAGVAVTGVLLSGTGVAQASPAAAVTSASTSPSAGVTPASPGAYCGTYGSGLTEAADHIFNTWIKKADSCHDINITYTMDSHRAAGDRYEGALWTGSGWKACSRKYQYLGNGDHNPNINSGAVPCTNVAAGTKFTIFSYFSGEDTVHINY